MKTLVVLGVGYCGRHILEKARQNGQTAIGVRREAGGPGECALDDSRLPDMLATAGAIVATAPPQADGHDPYLVRFGDALAQTGAHLVYLSSAGVYGDRGGAFVDEGTPLRPGARHARVAAEAAWLALGATSLRLAGIYGPGRSAFDRLGQPAIRKAGVRFSRIHVADVAGVALAAADQRLAGPLNVADDRPAAPDEVLRYAAAIAGAPAPAILPYEEADLSAFARTFWEERRIVATGRLKRTLGHRLRFPDYRAGLAAIWQEESGFPTSAKPS